jgi:NAD(P)-dependent dehydrogenase (short-subunit alcohol dehydrogenase family)
MQFFKLNTKLEKMKSVIITGTSKGIGFETALAFAKAGYKVYATMRNPKTAPALQQKCEDENLSISIKEMDVDSDESVEQCIAAILKENGAIDVLVNNAGIERHGSIEELSMSDCRSVMETNYFGALRSMNALLPEMRKNRSGCIVNVSSVAGQIAFISFAAYNASKFALEAVSEALAGEVKPFNIRIALVQPGIINTQMAQEIGWGNSTVNPQARRFVNLYAALLKTAVAPSVVAEKILEIAESNTWQFRHPASPDAAPFLEWRKSMNDEQWVDWNAMNDEDWYNSVESTFGLNARQE